MFCQWACIWFSQLVQYTKHHWPYLIPGVGDLLHPRYGLILLRRIDGTGCILVQAWRWINCHFVLVVQSWWTLVYPSSMRWLCHLLLLIIFCPGSTGIEPNVVDWEIWITSWNIMWVRDKELVLCAYVILSFQLWGSFLDEWWYCSPKHFDAALGVNQFSNKVFCGVIYVGSLSFVNANCSWVWIHGDDVIVLIYFTILYIGLHGHFCMSEDINFWLWFFNCCWKQVIQPFYICDPPEVYSSGFPYPCHPAQVYFKGPPMFPLFL